MGDRSEDEFDENEWDVIDAEHEAQQLTAQFLKGDVGASLIEDAITKINVTESEEDKIKNLLIQQHEQEKAFTTRIKELESELLCCREERDNAILKNETLIEVNNTLRSQSYSLAETCNTLRRELDNITNHQKDMEKSAADLETFVEETINNSQSGYKFLSEARDKVAAILTDFTSLRDYVIPQEKHEATIEPAISFTGGTLQGVMDDINLSYLVYNDVYRQVYDSIRHSKAEMNKLITERERFGRKESKISVNNFEEGDIVMFFPTPKGDYLAFNIGAPHHYLSEESRSLIGHDPHFKEVYVIGRIIIKEEKVASDDNLSRNRNLHLGTTFFEVSIESISDLFPKSVKKGKRNQKPKNQL